MKIYEEIIILNSTYNILGHVRWAVNKVYESRSGTKVSSVTVTLQCPGWHVSIDATHTYISIVEGIPYTVQAQQFTLKV